MKKIFIFLFSILQFHQSTSQVPPSYEVRSDGYLSNAVLNNYLIRGLAMTGLHFDPMDNPANFECYKDLISRTNAKFLNGMGSMWGHCVIRTQ